MIFYTSCFVNRIELESSEIKTKNFLTNRSKYDKLSKLLATEKLQKQKIKKSLTMKMNCDRLTKLSQKAKARNKK